jgi:hypothetical protein
MAKFSVTAHVTVSCWTEVEADTEEEARAIANSRELAEFHIDGTYPVDECWHLEADGAPYDLKIDR